MKYGVEKIRPHQIYLLFLVFTLMKWQYKLIGFVYGYDTLSFKTDFTVITFFEMSQEGHHQIQYGLTGMF